MSTQPSGSAALNHSTHARHEILNPASEELSLDDALHLANYRFALDRVLLSAHRVIDLGSGAGYGVELISRSVQHAIGVDLLAPRLVPSDLRQSLSFIQADCTSASLPSVMGGGEADVVLSMETLEHLVDYHQYLRNVQSLLGPSGTLVLATPNRFMTYERYPNRCHSDPSHVQEFTVSSLKPLLEGYFSEVSLWFKYVPGFWDSHDSSSGLGTGPALTGASWSRSFLSDWIPPVLQRRARQLVRSRTLSAEAENEWVSTYQLQDVKFANVESSPALASDAFGLVAICTEPIRL